MSSLNSFSFTGRLGRDPELKSLPSGNEVCSFTVAVDTFGDRPTLWVDVSVWGAAGPPCAKYLSKGSEVAVQSTVDGVAAFEKRDGTTGVSLRVSSRDVSFIGGRQERSQQSDVPTSMDTDDFRPVPAGGGGASSPADDDIPFAPSVI